MGYPGSAPAASLSTCVKKSTGAIRLAGKKCKKGETPLVLDQTGPMGPPGPAGNIKAYDNDGQFLGFLMSDMGEIYIPSLRSMAGIGLDTSDTGGSYGDIRDADPESAAHFAAVDCGGPPYFWPRHMETNRIVKRSGKYYIAWAHSPVKLLALSHRYTGGDGSAPVCDNTPWDSAVWMVPGFDYTETILPFTTPLAFPLRLE